MAQSVIIIPESARYKGKRRGGAITGGAGTVKKSDTGDIIIIATGVISDDGRLSDLDTRGVTVVSFRTLVFEGGLPGASDPVVTGSLYGTALYGDLYGG